MKQGQPPKRKKPLVAKKAMKRTAMSRTKPAGSGAKRTGQVLTCVREGCGKQFYARPSEIGRQRKFCSRECWKLGGGARRSPAGTERVRKVMSERTGEKNPNYKHGRRVGATRRSRARRFTSGQTTCQHPLCPGTERRTNEHHVVYEQHVRKLGGDVDDPRNALCLCVSCHPSHHRRGKYVVPLSALRDENFEFARELLGPAAFDYLRRRYGGEDDRLMRLLAVG